MIGFANMNETHRLDRIAMDRRPRVGWGDVVGLLGDQRHFSMIGTM